MMVVVRFLEQWKALVFISTLGPEFVPSLVVGTSRRNILVVLLYGRAEVVFTGNSHCAGCLGGRLPQLRIQL